MISTLNFSPTLSTKTLNQRSTWTWAIHRKHEHGIVPQVIRDDLRWTIDCNHNQRQRRESRELFSSMYFRKLLLLLRRSPTTALLLLASSFLLVLALPAESLTTTTTISSSTSSSSVTGHHHQPNHPILMTAQHKTTATTTAHPIDMINEPSWTKQMLRVGHAFGRPTPTPTALPTSSCDPNKQPQPIISFSWHALILGVLLALAVILANRLVAKLLIGGSGHIKGRPVDATMNQVRFPFLAVCKPVYIYMHFVLVLALFRMCLETLELRCGLQNNKISPRPKTSNARYQNSTIIILSLT